MPPSTFKLDPAIFNANFYKRVTDFWLSKVDNSGRELDMNVAKRWFGAGTPEEKRQFDGECRELVGAALESIGPAKFPEPNAQPVIDELKRVSAEGIGMGTKDEDSAWTALSFVLLLDQMPRNLFRTGTGLRSVYTHYDKMSFALASHLLSSDSAIPRPDTHPMFRRSAAHRGWFYMPLMHSEDIAAHDVFEAEIAAFAKELEGMQGVEGSKAFLERMRDAEVVHRRILEKFGRYPHRNAAMGRESTAEEVKFLAEGGATFGVAVEQK
ncbi:hypothetical protein J1614_002293 [Plenodomus biglobosus]|nr:hypothetical protein J1614_002293 [Plenodomus biglobosus]